MLTKALAEEKAAAEQLKQAHDAELAARDEQLRASAEELAGAKQAQRELEGACGTRRQLTRDS
jgi:hypothetical protein